MRKPRTDEERQTAGRRLQSARKAAGVSQKALAERVGVPQSVVSDWENGKLDSWVDKIEDIAGAFGVMPDDITGSGVTERTVPFVRPPVRHYGGGPGVPIQPKGDAELMLLPIVGEAQAGAWLAIDEYDQREPELSNTARDPRFPNARQWLRRVRGDSVNRLGILDGFLVHCVDVDEAHYEVNTDDVVEVERSRFQGSDLEYSIKQVEKTPEGILLWPRSTNPRWNRPLSLTDGKQGEDLVVRISGLVLNAIMPVKRF
jgi:transcriptional regulator with XRE-family HTH domain